MKATQHENPLNHAGRQKRTRLFAKEPPSSGSERRLVVPLRVLRLTLKRKWFDMIASGEKKEEYRVPGPWINSRIHGKKYDVVEFKNGYGPNVPRMVVEYRGTMHGLGKPEWGGNGTHVLVICLGRVLSLHNVRCAPTGAVERKMN